MPDIIYLSAPETPKTPIREQLLSFALSAMASPDMPDHWHMLIDFASFGDEIIFSDGEPDCLMLPPWAMGDRHTLSQRFKWAPNYLGETTGSILATLQLTTWDDLTADD